MKIQTRVPEPQREDAHAVPSWPENQYWGRISHYYCNTSLRFKQPMSEELRHAITRFLSAIHGAFKLPDSQSNSYTWNHKLFFPLPPKLQTHSATMLKLVGSPLLQSSHSLCFTFLVFPRALAARGLTGQLFEWKAFPINQQIAKGKKH